MIGQLSLFDMIEQPSKDVAEKYLEEVVLRGTGFVHGKKRVYQFYQETMTATERTQRIKKEYGLGGAGWPLDGYGLHGYDTYSNGIKIQYRTELGEYEKIFAWKQVEEVIHSLVDSGKYQGN